MPGPWEKYQAAPAQGPWSKYAAPALSQAAGPDILDEMHPAFSFGDRAKVKNFSNSDESSAKYLQQQHPELEVRAEGGKILARGKGEQQYRVLDPSSFDLQDISDIGWDVASGIGSGIATAAGGVAGNLPGAALAGGASSAALEGARQGIGGALGINEEADWGGVGLAGGLGAVSPFLLGTGASAQQVKNLGKEALESSGREFLTEGAKANALKAAEDAAAQSQRGLLGRGYQKVTRDFLPAVGEKLSGANRETIKNLNKYLPEFDKLDEMGRTEFANDATQQLQAALEGTTNKAFGDFEKHLTESIAPVDVTPELAEFSDFAMNEMNAAKALGNEEAVRQAEGLMKMVQSAVSTETKSKAPPIDVAAAVKGVITDVGEKIRLDKHESWQNYANSLKQAGVKVNLFPAKARLDAAISQAEGEAKRLGTSEPLKRVAALRNVRDEIFKKRPKAGEEKAVTLFDASGNAMEREAPERFLLEAAPEDALRVKQALAEAAEMSSTPAYGNSVGNRFGPGASNLDKHTAELARQASRDVEEQLFQYADNESKARFAQIARLETRLRSKLNNPETAERTLRNLDPQERAVLFEEFASADREFGSNLIGTATAIQGSGAESTSRSAINPVLSGSAALKLQRQFEDMARRNKAVNPEDRLGSLASNMASRIEQKVLGSLGGKGDAPLQTYRYAKGMKDIIMPHFKDAERANRTLGSLGGKGKKVLLERLGETDAMFGTDNLEKARLLDASNVFAKPSLDPISAGGTTSTSRTIPASAGLGSIGYWLGANFIPGQGGAGLGAGLGVGLGSMLGAPATIKKVVKYGGKAENLAKKLRGMSPVPPQAAPISAWQALMDSRQD